MQYSIVVVDDEIKQAEIIAKILEDHGYSAKATNKPGETIDIAKNGPLDLVITDQAMPGMDGIKLLEALSSLPSPPLVVILTGYGTISKAVEAMKKKAFDYITKPIDMERLLLIVKNALELKRLDRENRELRAIIKGEGLDTIIGSSGIIEDIKKIIRKIAPTNSTVLITGESGTGKELVAQAIHNLSLRKNAPFKAVNCAAIPDTLIESELFGYEKGAFTGANASKQGIISAADGGTLFLDEISELSLSVQAKLLRLIQNKEIKPLGSAATIPVDIRIMAATNKTIEQEIKNGRFREDLYYRLNVIPIQLPPLRERKTDIPVLIEHFLKKYNYVDSKHTERIDEDALALLLQYNWPGNVRQLESVIERTILLNDDSVVSKDDLPIEIKTTKIDIDKYEFELPESGINFYELEKEILVKAMKRSDGVIAKAADLLGMSYRTLQYRLEKFKISKKSEKVQ
ncbi:MAG: sigma-54 dependent transcriptional regulator [Deltaproteobacteria bacterium]|nr:sigma-54 dependent transcriptional regulator [Deltaproteobacteria bacterium]MCL5277773.1 sigma-54 dependent transcriptional regulator [Deltaproteobacteria bacterium]